jgi:hypothetical protein
MEQSKAMEYESRKASSDVLKPRKYIYIYILRKILLILTIYGKYDIYIYILRKISVPVNSNNIWRIRDNMEIDKLIEGADIVRFIKTQRIKWLGHIQRMDQDRPT